MPVTKTEIMPSGSIVAFAGTLAPPGWLICDGTSYSTTVFASLFSILAYSYGGAGASFNVPNLKGKVIHGLDSGQTEFTSVGTTGGSKTSTATHTHSANGTLSTNTTAAPSTNTSNFVGNYQGAFTPAAGNTGTNQSATHTHGLQCGIFGANISLQAGTNTYALQETFHGTSTEGQTHNHDFSHVHGLENHTHDMASHTHSMQSHTHGTTSGGNVDVASGNLVPYLTMNYIIKI